MPAPRPTIGSPLTLLQILTPARDGAPPLETVLQGVADGITVQDASGQVIYANVAAARLIGVASPDELLQVGAGAIVQRFDMLDEAGAPFPAAELPGRRVLHGEVAATATLRFRHRDTGREHWAVVKATPILGVEGKPQFAINVFVDVTERKRAEETQHFLADASRELAGSLDYEETVQRVAHLAVPALADWCSVDILTPEGAIRSLAVAHSDPARLALAQLLRDRYPVSPTDSGAVPQVLRTGQAVLMAEITDAMLVSAARDDAHLRMLRDVGFSSALIVPLQARGGTLGALTLVWSESGRRAGPAEQAVAEQLAATAALAIDNALLYRAEQGARQTAERAADAFKDLDRLKDEFLGAISHDLKNPLMAIRGQAQLLRRRATRAGTADITRLADGLAEILTSTDRITGMLNELLDLTRLEMARPLELDRRPLDLVLLARRVLARAQGTTSSHRLRLETTVEVLGGVWDAARLERVFDNLLSNAIKYSPNGGTIVVAISQAEHTLPAGIAVGQAILSVRDDGLGVPPADLPHIFERFWRGSNVLGRVAGTGIGLFGARQIVEQHGGSLTVESTEGTGSVFTVSLPLDLTP